MCLGHNPSASAALSLADTGSMEGLERLRTKLTIDLHPSKLASPGEGVRAHLTSLLLRYSEDLEGVVLSFANERVLTTQASIHPYFPFVRLEVLADLVLFRPRAGMRLVGTVNKVGADYLGLLVLGFINASVAADQIRAEFRPRFLEQCWVSSKVAGHRLEAGVKVHFTVAKVQHHGQFVSISGSLQQPGTGAEGFAKAPKPAAAAAAAGAKGDQAQQQQQQKKRKQQQQEQPEGQLQQPQKGEKKKRRKEAAAAAVAGQQQAAAPAPVQHQQPPPEQPPAGKKAKKAKQQQQHQQQEAAPAAPAEATPAAAAAAAGEGSKKKDKKRKAEAAAAPAETTVEAATAGAPAAANGSGEQHKKKKKRKDRTD